MSRRIPKRKVGEMERLLRKLVVNGYWSGPLSHAELKNLRAAVRVLGNDDDFWSYFEKLHDTMQVVDSCRAVLGVE